MEQLVVIVAFLHLFYCPFTKVEESFNIQATHDIIYHKLNISEYDHNEFPGVVPRTFIGPLFISLISLPFVLVTSCLGLSKFASQIVVRGVLGLTVLSSFLRLNKTLEATFGKKLSIWYLLITASQYHFMFYMTRPLPNILTLPLVLLALDCWIKRKHAQFIILSGAAIVLFRGELVLYLGIILLMELYNKSLNVVRLLKIVIPAGLVLLAATVTIDSYFWSRLLWPEGEVFWYNTILNKSSDWGTSPFLWYFYSAIPRSMAASVFLLPIGIYLDLRVRKLVFPALCFVFLFSFLPHKELRFIIYVFPMLNVGAAAACHRIWENRMKSPLYGLLALSASSHLIVNASFTLFLLLIAGANYPGGVAMSKIHQLASNDTDVYLHIDNLAAQTGVTRFTQLNHDWRYSKEENLTPGSARMMQFTHLLVEAKSKYSTNLRPYIKTHDILESVDGFSHIAFNYKSFPPVRVKTKPMIFILRRKDDVEVPALEDELQEEVVAGSVVEFSEEIPQSSVENYSIDEEIQELAKGIEDEELLEELNEINQMQDGTSTTLIKMKENIKQLLVDYKQQLVIENKTKDDVIVVSDDGYDTELETNDKSANQNVIDQGPIVDDLVGVLSLKEAEIIKDDGTIDNKDVKKKVKKVRRKKGANQSAEKRDENIEGDDDSWLSYFR